MKLFEYGQVLTLLLVFIALLAVTDAASRLARMRLNRTANRKPRTPAPGEKSSARSRISSKRWLVPLLVLSMFAACFPVAGFSFAAFTSTGMLGRVGMFVQHMLPPDLSWAFVQGLGTALLQTIAISLLGTLIGLALAVVLALPATSTLVFLPRDSPGEVSILERIVRWFLFWSARLVLNVLRSIPELVWVLICILAVGVGPFAGTIALGLHTAGVLGKLYAETMEEVPVRPIEALRSLGARPLQILLWAIWPQARPLLSSYTVLRWEMNLRASTILGLVGGGGLGQAIYNNVQLGFYSRLSTLIVVIYALVLTSDWIGERFRLKVA
jgi:phosphonate transport system permease protein